MISQVRLLLQVLRSATINNHLSHQSLRTSFGSDFTTLTAVGKLILGWAETHANYHFLFWFGRSRKSVQVTFGCSSKASLLGEHETFVKLE